ncbi:MAG: ABC transporter permease [Methanomassiliicoccales archaeon]
MAVKNHLRTLKLSAWLGWEMEYNWTNPWLFALYSIVKPISATLILVIMYLVIWDSVAAAPEIFSYMFVGNAFYMYVAQVLFGIVMVVHEDREHYQTLKQVYIAPISFYLYIVGRAVPKIVITTVAALITLAFGVLVLGLPLELSQVDWLMLSLAMAVGLFCICMIGIALAGVSMLTAKHSMGINEGIAGMFYLFCGVVFPITFLPTWGEAIGRAIPITYWLEMVRRAMLPEQIRWDSGLSAYSTNEMILALLGTSMLFLVLSLGIFKYADYLARKKGKLDMTTTY